MLILLSMTPVSHAAAAFLIVNSSTLLNYRPTNQEYFFCVLAAVLIDLDIFYLMFLGKNQDTHRNYITHTPVGLFIIWFILILIFRNYFSLIGYMLILASLFSHIFLDSLGYWLSRAKLQNLTSQPQIRWFYPFDKMKIINEGIRKFDGIWIYLKKGTVSLMLEFLLVVTAL